MTDKKTPNIYQRINAVMADVEYIQKEGATAKGLPYKSVRHDQVTGALHGPMQKHGIVMLPDLIECVRNGNMTSVTMALTFVNIDIPEDRFTIHARGDGIDQQDKGIGKAVSYAVKYGLLKTFCLETGDDPEKDSIDHKPAAPSVISEEQRQAIELLINGHEDVRKAVLSKLGGKIESLLARNYEGCMVWIRNMIDAKEAS